MGKRSGGIRGFVCGLFGLGLVISGCSGGPPDCNETRTCPVPVGFIDAGNFDDWWTAGAAGEDAEPAEVPGAGGAAGESGVGGADAATIAEPPRVLGVSPTDGVTGVPNDAQIVLTFSRAIDEQAFQAAYQSRDLPASEIDFAWNDARTVLTMKPKSALSYQTGPALPDGSADFLPKIYHYGFDDFTIDDQGHVLPGATFAFSTLRQVSTELPADALRTGNWTDGEGEGIHNCLRAAKAPYSPTVCIGDDANNIRYTGFVSFDLRQLPAGIRQVSSARLLTAATQYGSADSLGASHFEHLEFGELGAAAITRPASANVGPFYDDAQLTSGAHFELTLDVTADVAADYANREVGAGFTQYRFGFANVSANGTWDDIELTTSDIRLSSTYLVP